jgi:hypothetical protein
VVFIYKFCENFKNGDVFGLLMKVNIFRYEGYIFVGILMIFLTLGKLVGFYDISSDWFWFLAGVGLVFEGLISLVKQKRFDRKYKIIER